jgi:hypothetical protein
MSRKSREKKNRARPGPARKELPLEELARIIERARSALSESDYATLKLATDTLAFLTQELAAKGTTIDRLRRWLFGPSSEKTSRVGGEGGEGKPSAKDPEEKPAPPGHGRNGAARYTGATRVKVPHVELQRGAACPCCQKGKVYPAPPSELVRVRGMAPLAATIYECDRLRCNLCGEVYTAETPPGVGDAKYDETASSMIGLLKYGTGTPFNRIEKLEAGFGIPLPAATQWEVVEQAAKLLEPAHEALVDEAAQGRLLHNDDTTAKILELCATPKDKDTVEDEGDERTGVFTTAIVSENDGHRIALFCTGPRHAGENLADVLARRAESLAAPIQMCDALSRNLPGELKTILAHCMAHARRRFVDVVNDFPDECKYLLETLGKVYGVDADARKRSLGPDERLSLHQSESGPVMEELAAWLQAQFDERKVEPNSGLGEAIRYMQKHWEALTLFLRVPGAPLDNNICERALKKAILHRKNAYFYKTQNGARVGDIYMSLIHTAELSHENPFEYLVALQRHAQEVAVAPRAWLPWNYRAQLARLGERAAPS